MQLDGAAGVYLANSTLDSQTLNISDNALGTGNNDVKLANVTFVGHGSSGLLIELTDPGDRLTVGGSSFNYPLSIVFRATGARTLPDSGGSIVIGGTALTANGPDSAGISITASTSKGSIQVANPLFNGPTIVVLADKCTVALPGQVIDCRSASLAAALQQQVQAAGH